MADAYCTILKMLIATKYIGNIMSSGNRSLQLSQDNGGSGPPKLGNFQFSS